MALNKLAQREKVLYAAGISGSNDTTGKDCVRYGVRQCFYGQTAAAAIGPLVVKTEGLARAEPGNRVALALHPEHCHVFDADGQALERTVQAKDLPVALAA